MEKYRRCKQVATFGLGVTDQCDGEVKEISQLEDGKEVLYEACNKCGHAEPLHPTTLSEVVAL